MMPIKNLTLLGLFILCGCREFYDEEYEEFEASRPTQSEMNNVSYRSNLRSTDPNLVGLDGTAMIKVNEEDVDITIDVDGIPQNIINPHYTFISADCSTQNFTIPNDLGTTRSFNISERITTTALESDLRSSGAYSGNINLEGKSIIVKAFSTLTNLPDTTATNSIVVACGEIEVDDQDNGTTTTGTTGGTLGGTIGGTDAGTTDGTVGGTTGGTVGGSF